MIYDESIRAIKEAAAQAVAVAQTEDEVEAAFHLLMYAVRVEKKRMQK